MPEKLQYPKNTKVYGNTLNAFTIDQFRNTALTLTCTSIPNKCCAIIYIHLCTYIHVCVCVFLSFFHLLSYLAITRKAPLPLGESLILHSALCSKMGKILEIFNGDFQWRFKTQLQGTQAKYPSGSSLFTAPQRTLDPVTKNKVRIDTDCF